jgi:IS5 family transposase
VVNDLLSGQGLLLKAVTVVDATLIAVPSLTKNKNGQRGCEMHQSKKSNQWYFGMKCHSEADAASGLVHRVCGTSGNVNDVVEANSLMHRQESLVFVDASYQGVPKRPDATVGVNWRIALRLSRQQVLDRAGEIDADALVDQIRKLKASVRAKLQQPFRVIKRQFDHVNVRYRGLKRNTAQPVTLFALSNLRWHAGDC